ncbi:unnamed protein product [Rotaria socialis]|uniref:Uncharacterized protein n=1 Tax=Rotaria socialis TaxID=392032 RepID=A0A821SN87_9BILA|nr:unnamed protein product [Rotaria socialis]
MASKSGAVGTNMPAALEGNTAGAISENYKGKPRNANPQHPHNPENSQPVADGLKIICNNVAKKNVKRNNNFSFVFYHLSYSSTF